MKSPVANYYSHPYLHILINYTQYFSSDCVQSRTVDIYMPLDNDDIDKRFARLEAGFVAGNMLLQGSVMGGRNWFTTDLNDEEIKGIRKMTGIKVDDVLLAIVSIGFPKSIEKY